MTDLLARFLPHLDKHLALCLLDYYVGQGYTEVQETYDAVLAETALTPDGVREGHDARIEELTVIAQPALDQFFDNSGGLESTYQLKYSTADLDNMRKQGELSLEYLQPKYGINQKVMHAVLELAYLYYDKASYIDAAELLVLCNNLNGFNLPIQTVLWGRLMCETLAGYYGSAKTVANLIRNEQNGVSEGTFRPVASTTVRARVWLLHWILFPFFKGGAQYPGELHMWVFGNYNTAYREVIETVCPYYTRYVCAAALLNQHRSRNIRLQADLVKSVSHSYSDALTRTIAAVRANDLESALDLLPAVRQLISEDYFLCDFQDTLIDKIERLIFQRYVAIHSCVSFEYVASKLKMDVEEAEVWLVGLVSDTKQRGKVDSVQKQLNVEPQAKTIEQQVFDQLELALRK